MCLFPMVALVALVACATKNQDRMRTNAKTESAASEAIITEPKIAV